MQAIQKQSDVDDALTALLTASPELVPFAKRCGQLPLRLHSGGFAGLARIIIGQQVSTASAAAIHARYLENITPNNAKTFLEAGETVWKKIGLSRPKQRTLVAVSEAVLSGTVDTQLLATLEADEAISVLTSIKGIGPWTAEIYMLFCCGHPDIFPAGDLALQEGVRTAFDMDTRPSEKQLRTLAKKWSPYKGIAARLFWAYYSRINSEKSTVSL